MVKMIATRRAKETFADLSRGDFQPSLDRAAEDVHHAWSGEHALGGHRNTRDALRRWFERFYVLFPEARFEVQHVAVSGPLWNLQIAVEWTLRGRAADDVPFENEGTSWMRIESGKAVDLHAYVDGQRVAADCERMARAGIQEAAAPPIVD